MDIFDILIPLIKIVVMFAVVLLTVAELVTAGVGAVFVPYPAAVDDHQTANCRYLTESGAAEIDREQLRQSHLARQPQSEQRPDEPDGRRHQCRREGVARTRRRAALGLDGR